MQSLLTPHTELTISQLETGRTVTAKCGTLHLFAQELAGCSWNAQRRVVRLTKAKAFAGDNQEVEPEEDDVLGTCAPTCGGI